MVRSRVWLAGSRQGGYYITGFCRRVSPRGRTWSLKVLGRARQNKRVDRDFTGEAAP
jgi:hypothetical protein